MKKIFFAAALALVAVSCGTPKGYTILGSVADTALNGKTVYLSDYNKRGPIDSTIIVDGKFEFTGTVDTASVFSINLEKLRATVLGVNEKITVELGNPSVVSGKGLNAPFGKMQSEIAALSNTMKAFSDSVRLVYTDMDSLRTVLQPKFDEYRSQYKAVTDRELNANKDNVLGVYCVYDQMYDCDNLQSLDSLLAIVPSSKEFGQISEYRQSLLNRENTQEGKMFVDIKGKDVENVKEVALSEYVGKGNYVLVDFWASWCGPCKGEIPNLKAAHDTYKDKGLVVLGMNVWDKYDAFKNAIEEEGMTWSHIYASDNKEATQLYGINGIPTIILFAPDGTIVSRTLRGEEIGKKLAEIYSAKK